MLNEARCSVKNWQSTLTCNMLWTMLSRVDSWKRTCLLRIDHTRRTCRILCRESMIKKKKNTLMINKNNENQNWEKQSFERKNIAKSVRKRASDANLKIMQSWIVQTYDSSFQKLSSQKLLLLLTTFSLSTFQKKT